jgi:energy-coupling factor transporter ATP-binding protein EcfA2
MPKTDRSRPVTDRALQRLSAWAARKPRVALMGEFSSGKSTLLNLLLGEDLLPTRVTATELPPVWFSHGEPRAFWMDRAGQRHALDFGSFEGVPRSALCIRIFAPAPILGRCDILDTPGISDPNLEEESWRFPLGQASFVLWCTPATQAWRETERSTWLSLPERLRACSLVVVTRADKLSAADREKVARRVRRETAGFFDGHVLLAGPDALRGRAELAETGNANLWEASGGAELAARLDLALASARAARARLLRRYHLLDAPRAEEVVPLRLVESPEPMRPPPLEGPDTRWIERPLAQSAPDPLDKLRADWRAVRSAEPPLPEGTPVPRLAEPLPVLHLTDPLPRPDLPTEALTLWSPKRPPSTSRPRRPPRRGPPSTSHPIPPDCRRWPRSPSSWPRSPCPRPCASGARLSHAPRRFPRTARSSP